MGAYKFLSIKEPNKDNLVMNKTKELESNIKVKENIEVLLNSDFLSINDFFASGVSLSDYEIKYYLNNEEVTFRLL